MIHMALLIYVKDNSHIVQEYNSSLLCPTGGKAERMRFKSLCKRIPEAEKNNLKLLRAFSRSVRGLDPKNFPSDLRVLICLWVLCLSLEGEQWPRDKGQRKKFQDRYCPYPKLLRVHWCSEGMTLTLWTF